MKSDLATARRKETSEPFRATLEGDVAVFRSLFQKRNLLSADDPRHRDIRPLLIVMPGTMRGVAGGGQVTALHDAGLVDTFDNVIGISTGAPTVAYFLAGQARIGTSIYYDDLPEHDFISLERGLLGEHFADIDLLCSIMRGEVGEKALDTAALRTSRTHAHIPLTHYPTAAYKTFNFDDSVDAVEVLRAAVALPIVYGELVYLDGVPYVDGGMSMPFPDRHMLDQLDPTDILVLANRSVHTTASLVERAFLQVLGADLPAPIMDGIIRMTDTIRERIDQLRARRDVNRAIIWFDGLEFDEMSHTRLRHAERAAYRHLHALLTEHKHAAR